jgi:hypothetical protein
MASSSFTAALCYARAFNVEMLSHNCTYLTHLAATVCGAAKVYKAVINKRYRWLYIYVMHVNAAGDAMQADPSAGP